MPEIKEEVLVKLYSEIDVLENKNKELKDEFINLKQNSNKVVRQNRNGKLLLLLLLFSLLGAILFFYTNDLKQKEIWKNAEEQKTVLLDSINKISALIPNKHTAEVVYSIQLGVYKDLDIQFNEGEAINFEKVQTNIGNVYQIGSFLSYKTATSFKNDIKKLGLKDVFLVSYNKNKEKINIRKALVLSNEEEFLDD
jgi:hypothetical protein